MEIIVKDVPKDMSHCYSVDMNLKELNVYAADPETNPEKGFTVDQSVIMCQYDPKNTYDSIEIICTISNTVSSYHPKFENTFLKLIKFGKSLKLKESKKSKVIEKEPKSFMSPRGEYYVHAQFKLDIGNATCVLSDNESKLVLSSSFGISHDSKSVTQFTSDKNLISFHYANSKKLYINEVLKVDKVSLKIFNELPMKILFKAETPTLTLNHIDILQLSRISKNVVQNIKFPDSNPPNVGNGVIFKIDISDYTNDITINDAKLILYFQNIISPNVIKGIEVIKPKVEIGKETIVQIEKVQVQNVIQKSSSFKSMNQAFNPNLKYEEVSFDSSLIHVTIQTPEVVFAHDTNLGMNSDKLGMGIKGLTNIIQREWKDTIFVTNFNSTSNTMELPMTKLSLFDVKLDFDDNPIEKSLAIHLQIWEEEYSQRVELEQILMNKTQDMNMSQKELEKIYQKLSFQRSQVYQTKISQFKKTNVRPTGLMSIRLEHGEVLLFQKDCLKTEKDLMASINEYSTAPLVKDGNEFKKFETIFGTTINGKFYNAFIFLRNFPDPFLKVKEVSSEGNVCFAQYPSKEETTIIRKIIIENDEEIEIAFSIEPFYMYYKAHANAKFVEMVVGTPMDPVFEDLSILTRRMSPTPLDPSEELEWWDWARLHMHGNYEACVSEVIVRLIFGLNCYDPVDYAEGRIRYVNGTGFASKYEFTMHDLFVHQNPSLSSFPSITEFPYVAIILRYDWVCKQDPFEHYFDIKLPKEFRTEEGIKKYKDEIIYDSYETWRSSHVDCVFECIIGNESTDFCNNSESSIMFDPLSTGWMVKLIKFMDNPPLQLHLGKSYKYMLPRRKQYDVIDISKSFQLHFVVRNLNILFSNGLEDNNLVNLKIGYLKLFIYLWRENLPDQNLLKMTRKKEEHLPINMNCHLKDIEVSVNNYSLDDKFDLSTEHQTGKEVIVSVGDVSYYMDSSKDIILEPFVKGNEKVFIKQITPGFEHQLLIKDVNIIWSAIIRDAVMIWIDVAQQFAFDELEVAQRLTLTKIKQKTKSEEIENSSNKKEECKSQEELLNHLISGNPSEPKIAESKEVVLPFFSVKMMNVTGMLIPEDSDESMILKSNSGTVEVNKITDSSHETPIESHEIQALIKNMTGTFKDTKKLDLDNFVIIQQPINDLPIVMEESDWIVRFIMVQDPKYYSKTKKPQKQLHIEVPDLKVLFSSSQLQTLIDIITNTLVPKKLERTVTLQDRFATIMFNSKLDPDSLGNCGSVINKCETIRKKIRGLESQLNLLRREASVKISSEIVSSMDKIEIELKEQKALYHGMNKTLQKNVNQLLSKQEEESIVDMIINITLHSLSYEMIDKNGKSFVEFIFQLFKGSITKNKDYSIFHNYTLHQIIGKNKLPNPIYQDLLMPYIDSDHDIIEENDYMVRVLANTSKPVAGIKGYDHLEIDLSPLHLQTTFEFNQKLWSYLFPLSKQEKQEQTLISTSITPSTSTQISLERRQSTTVDEVAQQTLNQMNRSSTLLKSIHHKKTSSDQETKRGSSIFQNRNDSLSDIDEMKHRAKTVKVFNYIRMQEVQLFVSLMGVPDSESQISKYVRNFEKVKIHIKPITYNQVVLTWQDFFETLKYDIIKQSVSFIVPETVKSVTKSKITGIANILNPFSKISSSGNNVSTSTSSDSNENKISRTKKIQTQISKSKTVDSAKDAKLKILFGGKKDNSSSIFDSRKQLFGSKSVNKTPSEFDEKIINEEEIDIEEEEISKDSYSELFNSLQKK